MAATLGTRTADIEVLSTTLLVGVHRRPLVLSRCQVTTDSGGPDIPPAGAHPRHQADRHQADRLRQRTAGIAAISSRRRFFHRPIPTRCPEAHHVRILFFGSSLSPASITAIIHPDRERRRQEKSMASQLLPLGTYRRCTRALNPTMTPSGEEACPPSPLESGPADQSPAELIDKCVGSRIWVVMKGDKGRSLGY